MFIDYIKHPPECVLITAIENNMVHAVNFAGQPVLIPVHNDADLINLNVGSLIIDSVTKANEGIRDYFRLCVAAYHMDHYLERGR